VGTITIDCEYPRNKSANQVKEHLAELLKSNKIPVCPKPLKLNQNNKKRYGRWNSLVFHIFDSKRTLKNKS